MEGILEFETEDSKKISIYVDEARFRLAEIEADRLGLLLLEVLGNMVSQVLNEKPMSKYISFYTVRSQ